MKKGIKILVIVVDIVAIVCLISVTRTWILAKKNNSVDINDKPVKETSKNAYKSFTFNIPNDMEYQELSEYTFKFGDSKYDAVIELIVDADNYIYTDLDGFMTDLKDIGYPVKSYQKETINNIAVMVFETEGESKLYCFNVISSFSAIVGFHPKADDYDEENAIKEVMAIMYDSEYDEETKSQYRYHIFYKDN